MIIYDFDKTIYDGDSTIDFYFYCLIRKPAIIKYIFIQLFYFISYKLKLVKKDKMKEKFYIFLKDFNNINEYVLKFWSNTRKIKSWYLSKNHDNDIIISASPEFLLKPFCDSLNIKLIASKVDSKTGKLLSKNCYGQEKINRLKLELPNINVLEFYTDSLSDIPLLDIANKGYIVKKHEITIYKKNMER